MRGFILILATLGILLAPSAAAEWTDTNADAAPCVKQTSHSTTVNAASCQAAVQQVVKEITKVWGASAVG